MENKVVNPRVTEGIPGMNPDLDISGLDHFETENCMYEHLINGTTRVVFDRRKAIDRKNLDNSFVGQDGKKWDAFGECRICGDECFLRCRKCPWIFYCSSDHQAEDWNNHKKTCMNVLWYEDGHARATRDLTVGTVIMERSTIFVAPRFHTPLEMRGMTEEELGDVTDGAIRPCFGCHEVILHFLNNDLLCRTCKFPIHSTACAASPWHKAECYIFKGLNVKNWYDEFGQRENIMIHLAVLRGVLLKHSQPLVWAQIIALDPNPSYMTSPELKNSTVRFIVKECKVNWIEKEEIVHFLSIFMKHRLNCCKGTRVNKKMVSVICSGMIPFTLVRDENANVQGDVYDYRMKMGFRTIKPIVRGEILTIGRGGS